MFNYTPNFIHFWSVSSSWELWIGLTIITLTFINYAKWTKAFVRPYKKIVKIDQWHSKILWSVWSCLTNAWLPPICTHVTKDATSWLWLILMMLPWAKSSSQSSDKKTHGTHLEKSIFETANHMLFVVSTGSLFVANSRPSPGRDEDTNGKIQTNFQFLPHTCSTLRMNPKSYSFFLFPNSCMVCPFAIRIHWYASKKPEYIMEAKLAADKKATTSVQPEAYPSNQATKGNNIISRFLSVRPPRVSVTYSRFMMVAYSVTRAT